MTRTAITVNALTLNAGIAPTQTTVDTSNGHVLTVPGDGRFLLIVDNTGSVAASTVTIKAGDNPPAFQAGMGDLAVVVGTSGVHREAIVVETARFNQDDGTINIDAAGFSAATITAYSFPRSF
jgi:hypothetical protein